MEIQQRIWGYPVLGQARIWSKERGLVQVFMALSSGKTAWCFSLPNKYLGKHVLIHQLADVWLKHAETTYVYMFQPFNFHTKTKA